MSTLVDTHKYKAPATILVAGAMQKNRISQVKCITKNLYVNPLRQGWCKLLDYYKWTYFVTLTFKDFPKTYTAINRAKQFLRAIERKEKREIGYYIAMELTKLGCPHFHLLMGNLEGVKYSKWFTWWFTRYGGCRFKVYDPGKGATHYLTKYVVKSTSWYDVKGLEYMNQLTFDKKTDWCILSRPLSLQGVNNG